MSMQALNSLLWNQRELLETLIFKLEEESLLLTAGKSKWLPRATAEIQAVLDRVQEGELARAVESTTVALELGLDPDVSLLELSEAAPKEWSETFAAHRMALIQQMAEVEVLTSTNRDLLSTSQRAVQEALGHLDSVTGGYTATGAATSGESNPRLFDQNL